MLMQAQFYTGAQQEFGKNRVQYRDFNWLYYPYKKFEVYYYQGGKDLAIYTVQAADQELAKLEELFDYKLDDQVEVVVYNKMSEFRQSNVGITSDIESNVGGSTRIVGSKVFLYFTGDYQSYQRQLRSALSEVLISQMMFGGNWRQVIKNNALLQLPDWYIEGLVKYAEGKETPYTAARVQDGIESGIFEKFNRLEGENASYAGYALWKYVADVYGENVIPNILYMTKISRNIESGFLFVLGTSLASLNSDFLNYYDRLYTSRSSVKQFPDLDQLSQKKIKEKKRTKVLGEINVKAKKDLEYDQFKLSPDQEYLAYTTNELGQVKVWLYHIPSGKKRRIFKHGYPLERLNDKSYPVVAWHPSSLILTFVYEKKGRAFIVNYNLEEKKKVEKELFRIDKVIHMSYAPDGRKIIFSGVKEGQSDLYMYQTIGNNQTQLTNDIYDDLEATFIRDGNAVIFASNRTDDTLRTDETQAPFALNKDIFILSLEPESNVLERVSTTPELDEYAPFAYDDDHYTYLAQDDGYSNRYLAKIDSAISRIDTTIHYRFFTVSQQISDYSKNPISYEYHSRAESFGLVFYENGHPTYYLEEKAKNPSIQNGTDLGVVMDKDVPKGLDVLTIPPKELEEGQIDINDYHFEDDARDYTYEKERISLGDITTPADADSSKAEEVFELPKPRNYRLNFATDYVLSQVDNRFNSQFYQRNTGPSATFPGISGLVQLGISDLFEDYKIVGGFRLSASLNNSDIGLSYEDLSKRVDRRITIQRQGNRMVTDDGFGITEMQTYSAEYQYKYPFNELASMRISGTYRLDRSVALATDIFTLSQENQLDHNVGVKVQYVYDNTIGKGLNLYNGTRYKIWGEYLRDPFNRGRDVKVVGLDFRHYEKIHRSMILALRVAGHSSFGHRNIITYLGGVDNWLFQQIDDETPIPSGEDYFFQALGSPVRGFFVNARNGNSFGVANAEVRWPIFDYFLKSPIKSDFVQNFQVLGFADVGSAWTGSDPYDEENQFNQVVLEQNPVTITVDNNREPIIWGYGFGLRSRVLGYFVRADWAWGVDDNRVMPRVFHLSLTTDF
jgi:hypothetical protein